MIKLLRVDHRLLHGQVAMTWTQELDTNCILIACDAVVKDDVRKTTLKLDVRQASNWLSNRSMILSRLLGAV